MNRDEIEKFLTWATIVSTMFVGEAPYSRDEYDTLIGLDRDRWFDVIRECECGTPGRLSFDAGTSGNAVHQAYHLASWEIATGKRIDHLRRIIEIGGGYGAMARIARRAGFLGEYVMVDVPEFSLLQKYYLSQCQIEAQCVTGLSKYHKADLLIALFSLCEMTADEQEAHLKWVQPGGCLVGLNSSRPEPFIEKIESRVRAKRIAVDHTSSTYILG